MWDESRQAAFHVQHLVGFQSTPSPQCDPVEPTERGKEVDAFLLVQLYNVWGSQAQFGLANDIWFRDSGAVQVLLVALLQHRPSRPMQTLCDLLETEPMEPVFSTLTPHEVLVLVAVFVSMLSELSEPY
jgi:hypothetical protein